MTEATGERLVDWSLASSLGRRLSPAGPAVSFAEAADVVEDLRRHSTAAAAHVERVTQWDSTVSGRLSGRVAEVIDRPAWIDLNVESFRTVVGPLLDNLGQDAAGVPGLESVGRRMTALEVGGLLAFMSGRVLGQYEALASQPGRLVLVAPNVVVAEQAMDVEPADFRLWVCVHEVTHRAQFTAAPWLREHLLSRIEQLLSASEMRPTELRSRLSQALVETLRAAREKRPVPSVIDLAQSPVQRELVDEIGATMSLLEGHAEYVMNAVGSDAIPTLDVIQRRFQKRRESAGALTRLLRQVIGFEAKMRQYADGSRFVGAVVDEVGMTDFNRIWESPEALPTPAELQEPTLWARRVVA